MKKKELKAYAVAVLLMCSVGANAQTDLGSILGNVVGAATGSQSSAGGDDLVSTLTSVFSSKKQASTKNLVGTWVYTEPAIVLQSDNILTNAAAKIAAGQIESKLQTQLSKYGITPGKMKLTLNEDGTFEESIGTKTIKGKWTVKDKKLQMTYASAKTVSLTTQLSGRDLQFVTDATKLLTLFKTVGNAAGSVNANVKTITSLMKNIKGMQAGLTLRKQ